MTALRKIIDGISRWLDCVAATVVAMLSRFVSARRVRLVEQKDGAFAIEPPGGGAPATADRLRIVGGAVVGAVPASLGTMLQGSRAELILLPSRFLFRPLELPRRAAEFLEGVVRAQIDRLTPWTASEAAFAWSAPTAIANDRIAVTVAATARARITPYVQALAGLGAESITVSTFLDGEEAGPAPIKILEQRTRGANEVQRVRGALVAVLVVALLAATLATSASVVVGDQLEAQQDELVRRIAERRAAMRAAGNLTGPAGVSQALERRKHDSPSSVIVLEELSQLLPDHTYVTELRVQGDKMQVIGITRDAPSLIRLIEQSQHFTRATFFAPTTRSPSDPGERFHIEARIEPVFMPRS
jgi:general secretion pathway protein L